MQRPSPHPHCSAQTEITQLRDNKALAVANEPTGRPEHSQGTLAAHRAVASTYGPLRWRRHAHARPHTGWGLPPRLALCSSAGAHPPQTRVLTQGHEETRPVGPRTGRAPLCARLCSLRWSEPTASLARRRGLRPQACGAATLASCRGRGLRPSTVVKSGLGGRPVKLWLLLVPGWSLGPSSLTHEAFAEPQCCLPSPGPFF